MTIRLVSGWFCSAVLVTALVSFAPVPALGQVFTPSYLAPSGGGSLGVYVSDSFDDAAIEAIFRTRLGGYDIGLRPGVVLSGDPELLLGADLRAPLTSGAPIGFAFAGGAQGIVGDDFVLGATAGIVLGGTIRGEGISFTPYLHPRVAIAGGDAGSDADVLADVGLDVQLQSDLIFKLAVSFNDRYSSLGFGLAFR